MLDDKPELEPWSQTLWFVIRDPKGVTSGRLRAKLEWKPVVAVHDDSLLDAMLAETAAGRRVLEARRKEKLKEMWKKVDEDKSGALDADEIHAVLLLMGRKENEIKINRVMKAIDKDGSGTVDFAEFEIWWKRGTPKVYLAKVISDALVLEPNMSRYAKRIDFTFLSAPWTP